MKAPRLLRASIALLALLVCGQTLAGAPTIGQPLPTLSIDDRGELVPDGDDYKFVPWTSTNNPGTVHVIQYFGATLGDRDVFSAFTDLIQTSMEPGSVHVTTVLNMDAALWGTSGMVMSELKKNKKQHPEATMVIDEEGDGVTTWELGKNGTGLVIMDATGVVQFFALGSIPEEQLEPTIELMKKYVGS